MRSSFKPYTIGEVRRRWSALLTLLLIALLAVGSTGCGPGARKKEAQDLVKQGSDTAQHLAEYYESLAHARERTFELLDLDLRARLGRPLTEAERKPIDEQVEALRARANTARKLQGLYDALGKLIEYDAATEVKGAVNELKDEVIKLAGHPLSIPPLPDKVVADLLDRIVVYLVEMEQLRRFTENTPQALAVLDGIIQFYDSEKPLYVMIELDYERLRPITARFLAEPGVELIVSTGAFKEDVAPYGELLTKSTTNSVIREFNDDAARRILTRRLATEQEIADSHSIKLYKLERSTEAFLRTKPHYPLLTAPDLDETIAFVTYLQRALEEQTERKRRLEDARRMRRPQDPPINQDSQPPPSDPLSDYIVGLLSPGAKERLEDAVSARERAELGSVLAPEVNRVIQSGNVYANLEKMFSKRLQQRIKEFAEMEYNRPKLEAKRIPLERDMLAEFKNLLSQGRFGSNSISLTELQQFVMLMSTEGKESRVFRLHPTGRALALLNRLLLERAYPEFPGEFDSGRSRAKQSLPHALETGIILKETI